MKTLKHILTFLILATFLTACGGGEGGGSNSEVPPETQEFKNLEDQLSSIPEGSGESYSTTTSAGREWELDLVMNGNLSDSSEMERTAFNRSPRASNATINENNVQLSGQRGAVGTVSGNMNSTLGNSNFTVNITYSDFAHSRSLILKGSSVYTENISSIQQTLHLTAALSISGHFGAKMAYDLTVVGNATHISVIGNALIISGGNKYHCQVAGPSSGDLFAALCE